MGDKLYLSHVNVLGPDVPIVHRRLSDGWWSDVTGQFATLDRLNPWSRSGDFELIIDLSVTWPQWDTLALLGNWTVGHTWHIRAYDSWPSSASWLQLREISQGTAEFTNNRWWLTNFTGTLDSSHNPAPWTSDGIGRYQLTGSLGTPQFPTVSHPNGAGYGYLITGQDGDFKDQWSDITSWELHVPRQTWDFGVRPMLRDLGPGPTPETSVCMWQSPDEDRPTLLRITISGPADYRHVIRSLWLGETTRVPLRNEFSWDTVDKTDRAVGPHGGERIHIGPTYRTIDIPIAEMDRARYAELDAQLRGNDLLNPALFIYESELSPRLEQDLSGLFYPTNRRGPTGKISGFDRASSTLKLREWK